MNPSFNRRHFLRGLGTAVALPPFESLLPANTLAASAAKPATTASGPPLRVAYVYIPNGDGQILRFR